MTNDSETRVALVTGASRGIGRAIAVHLARAGFRVAIAARTLQEGERREWSSTLKHSDTSPLPGSLSATAALIAGEGHEVLTVYLDLLDRASQEAAVATVLEKWGRIDVLVNNARYVGPGDADLIMDVPMELLDKQLQANALAPIFLTKLVLPQMLDRGAGFIVNLASAVGRRDPAAAAGTPGGWSLGYGMSKGALNRFAGILNVELGERGIVAFNLTPGIVVTERIAAERAAAGREAIDGASPEVVGAVVAHLVTSPAALEIDRSWVEAQEVARLLGLLPGVSTAG